MRRPSSETDIVMVKEMNGFKACQRISAQDVEASPPQIHAGTVSSVWSDGTAIIIWDAGFTFSAENHLVQNGRVDLHHVRPLNS